MIVNIIILKLWFLLYSVAGKNLMDFEWRW